MWNGTTVLRGHRLSDNNVSTPDPRASIGNSQTAQGISNTVDYKSASSTSTGNAEISNYSQIWEGSDTKTTKYQENNYDQSSTVTYSYGSESSSTLYQLSEQISSTQATSDSAVSGLVANSSSWLALEDQYVTSRPLGASVAQPQARVDRHSTLSLSPTLPSTGITNTSSALNIFDNYTLAAWNSAFVNVTDSNATAVNFTIASTIPSGYLSGYTTEHVILASILVTMVMIIIVIGNGMVILAVVKDRNLKGVQNWFISSLAVSDLFVGLLIMPLSLSNELMGYWIFGDVLCELWLATDVLLCTASILNLCLISLDRYWSITRAVSYVKQRTRKRAVIMISTVWILSMIICLPPLVGWKRPQPYEYNKPLCVLSEEVGYVVYSTLGSFYIPLIVMVVVYFKIYLAARKRARRGLKKPIGSKPVHDNGKSLSTTTTSFSTPTKLQSSNKLSVPDELNSDEEPPGDSEIPSEHQPEGDGTTSAYDTDCQQNDSIKLISCTNTNARYKPMDEKRKLLSDDTDSACESPNAKRKIVNSGRPVRRIHFSEDTDSTSDCSLPQPHAKFNGFRHDRDGNDENMKPLLEDSQLESDSQRETENTDSAKSKGDQNVSPPAATDQNLSENSEAQTKEHGQDHRGLNREDSRKKLSLLSPSNLKHFSVNMIRKGHNQHQAMPPKDKMQKRPHEDPDRQKRRLARARERRAFIVLGIIMATFILCWFPFFSVYLVSSLCGKKCPVPDLVFAVFFWTGYVNSALNPLIYTIFNRDFRQAFHRLVCGRRR